MSISCIIYKKRVMFGKCYECSIVYLVSQGIKSFSFQPLVV